MYSFIELLRALAVLLITNSHFDGVYPWDISWGGVPGLCLFFIITGFLLVRGVKGNFFPWWLKKVIRLYIPMTIVSIITVLLGMKSPGVMLFLFPITSTLWYVPAITMLYIPYFILLYLDKNKKAVKIPGGARAPAIVLAVIIYFTAYIITYRHEFFIDPEVGFRPIYGFVAMMLGSYAYENMEKIAASRKGVLYIIGAVLCCGGFTAVKLLARSDSFSFVLYFQFMTQVFSVLFAVFALFAGICYEEKLKGFMKTVPGKLFGFISKASLEIYLVQFAVIRSLRWMPFPLNFILITAVIAVCALVVHFVSVKLTKAINSLLFERDKKGKKKE